MCHHRIGHLVKALAMFGVLVFTAGCPFVFLTAPRPTIRATHLQYADLPMPVRDAWQQQYPDYGVMKVFKIARIGQGVTFLIAGSRIPDERVIVTYDAQGNRRDVSVEPFDKNYQIGTEHIPFANVPTPVRDAWQKQYPKYTVTEVTRIRRSRHDELFLIGGKTQQERVVVTYDVQYDGQGRRLYTNVHPIVNNRRQIGTEHLPFADLPTPVRDAWQKQYPKYTVTEVTRIGRRGYDEIFWIAGSRIPDERVIVTYDAQGSRRDVRVESLDESPETAPSSH